MANRELEELNILKNSDLQNELINLPDHEFIIALTKNNTSTTNRIIESLNHNLASRMLSLLSIAQIIKILKIFSKDSLLHFLSLIQPSQIASILSHSNNELIKKIIDSAPSYKYRIGVAKSLPLERKKLWIDYVRTTENEFNETRSRADDASISLFEDRKRLLIDLDDAIKTRETMLENLEHESKIKIAHYSSLATEEESKLNSKLKEIEKKEKELAERIFEFEEETRKQVQERIEIKVPEYVAEALKVLDDREILYRKKAFNWGIQGILVLSAAIISATAISLYGAGLGASLESLPWQALLFVTFKGLIILSVLGLWAKHAFTVSNAYMHESIKRSDRAHAINFGKLYLEIYGNSVDRKELIDIFENWNITSESAFSKANPAGFEPQISDKIDTLLRIINLQKKED
ncbi:hypothetical protein [Janthinobacterium psychrotolerans]|uniref:Uncharacterized protein n=1 Tax=Janthinobacterium psychrotolerans TaxID=1747903 RepID=A0A1A7C7E6_9BURK|nr:hypothetical protein [Janthinobacterium psychrotolerans]OBV40690.1 hypothetical protein ASR47_101882 [Janthinobacterium psychrotolerans]